MNIFEALECVRAGYAVRHADWPAGTSLQLRHGYPALIEEAAHCSDVTTLSHLHERIPPAQLESTHWETVAVDGVCATAVRFDAQHPRDEAPCEAYPGLEKMPAAGRAVTAKQHVEDIEQMVQEQLRARGTCTQGGRCVYCRKRECVCKQQLRDALLRADATLNKRASVGDTAQIFNEALKTPKCVACAQPLMTDALGRCALCGARADHDISMTSRVMHIEAELADAEKHPELLQLINRLYRKHGASIAIDNLARAMAGGQRVPAQIVYGPGGRQRARAGAQHTCLDQAGDVVGLAALGRAGTPYPEAPHVFDDTRLDAARRQLDGIRHIIDGLGYKAPEQHESERLRIAVAIEQLQKTFML